MEASSEALPNEKDPKAVKAYFGKVFPDMDFERVYASDMKKMVKWFGVLKANNVASENISVMFRLPKETGEKFNEFIKENKLNSPIHADTKAVFVSGKIPKPIVEKKIHFNSIVNFNFYNIHHSIRNLIQWHYNVINIKSKKVNKIGLL